MNAQSSYMIKKPSIVKESIAQKTFLLVPQILESFDLTPKANVTPCC